MRGRDFPPEVNEEEAVRRLAGYFIEKKISILDVEAEANIQLADGRITPAQYEEISAHFNGAPAVIAYVKKTLNKIRKES